jgi:hypothetical protein
LERGELLLEAGHGVEVQEDAPAHTGHAEATIAVLLGALAAWELRAPRVPNERPVAFAPAAEI